MSYNASADELAAALSALPYVGEVQVSRQLIGNNGQFNGQNNGQFQWLVTFRALLGDVSMLVVDGSQLTGSSPLGSVVEVVKGSMQSLVSSSPVLGSSSPAPRLSVSELVGGFPTYRGEYIVDTPGQYGYL